MKEIDARGLACPAPVLQTKSAIEEVNPGLIKVIVDNEASKQNICRFLESRNFEIPLKFQLIRKQKPIQRKSWSCWLLTAWALAMTNSV